MKPKKIPLRTCVLTREKYDKKELFRIDKDKDNNITFDKTGKANGKGCYLKKDSEVILKAKDKKILNRVLETEVTDDIYEELLKLL